MIRVALLSVDLSIEVCDFQIACRDIIDQQVNQQISVNTEALAQIRVVLVANDQQMQITGRAGKRCGKHGNQNEEHQTAHGRSIHFRIA